MRRRQGTDAKEVCVRTGTSRLFSPPTSVAQDWSIQEIDKSLEKADRPVLYFFERSADHV
jgi:hypothetical protein